MRTPQSKFGNRKPPQTLSRKTLRSQDKQRPIAEETNVALKPKLKRTRVIESEDEDQDQNEPKLKGIHVIGNEDGQNQDELKGTRVIESEDEDQDDQDEAQNETRGKAQDVGHVSNTEETATDKSDLAMQPLHVHAFDNVFK